MYLVCNSLLFLLKIHWFFVVVVFVVAGDVLNPSEAKGEVTQRAQRSWSDSVEFHRHVCMWKEPLTDRD